VETIEGKAGMCGDSVIQRLLNHKDLGIGHKYWHAKLGEYEVV